MALLRAEKLRGASGASFGLGSFAPSVFDAILADRPPYLDLYLDPEKAGALGLVPASFYEQMRDLPVVSPTPLVVGGLDIARPTLFESGAGLLNNKRVFSWTASGGLDISEMRIGPRVWPASLTIILAVVPASASVDGTGTNQLLNVRSSATSRFALGVTQFSGTPKLFMQTGSEVGATWNFQSDLVGGGEYIIACTMDAASKATKIFCNSAVTPVITDDLTNTPSSYADTLIYIGGSDQSVGGAVCWQGIIGKVLVFTADLSLYKGGAFLSRYMAAMKTHYDIA